jgi:hypothetical protein
MEGIEHKLRSDSRVAGVASFIGAGPPRFYLPVDPEPLSSNYGQIVVNVRDYRDVKAIMTTLDPSPGSSGCEFQDHRSRLPDKFP